MKNRKTLTEAYNDYRAQRGSGAVKASTVQRYINGYDSNRPRMFNQFLKEFLKGMMK